MTLNNKSPFLGNDINIDSCICFSVTPNFHILVFYRLLGIPCFLFPAATFAVGRSGRGGALLYSILLSHTCLLVVVRSSGLLASVLFM